MRPQVRTVSDGERSWGELVDLERKLYRALNRTYATTYEKDPSRTLQWGDIFVGRVDEEMNGVVPLEYVDQDLTPADAMEN